MQSERETEMVKRHVNIITALKEDGKKLREKLQNNLLDMRKLLEIISKGKQLLKDNQTIVEKREAKIAE